MANSTYTSTPIAGVAFDTKTSDATLGPRVGTVVPILSDIPALQAKYAIFVKASGAIGNSAYVTVALTSISCLATSVDAGASGTAYCRNGSVAFTDGDYGWVYLLRPASVTGG